MRIRSSILVGLFSCVILLGGCASKKCGMANCNDCTKPCAKPCSDCTKPCSKSAKPCGDCSKPCGKAAKPCCKKSPCSKPCTKMSDADFAKWAKYGQKVTLAADKTVCAKDILANPDKFAGKQVRVCGTVDSVCAKKGCWIRLEGTEEADSLFVKFTCPVDGRLVPMEAKGKMAIVEGTLLVKEISENDARHYKEDSGASEEEVAKIVGPQKQISLRAPAAMVQGV